MLYGPDAVGEREADKYEPVLVEEIVVKAKKGNRKLKNPKAYFRNMDELPEGINIRITNEDKLDLSGNGTEEQFVEFEVTYSDESIDTVRVPLVIK